MKTRCAMRGCKRTFRDASAAASHVQRHRPLRADEKSEQTLKFPAQTGGKTGVDSPKVESGYLDASHVNFTVQPVTTPRVSSVEVARATTHEVGEYWAGMIYPCKCYCHFYEKGEINPCNEKECVTW